MSFRALVEETKFRQIMHQIYNLSCRFGAKQGMNEINLSRLLANMRSLAHIPQREDEWRRQVVDCNFSERKNRFA